MFCAGGDLNWMKAQLSANRSQRIAEATKLAMMLNSLNEMPVPLIGRLHGGAFGGGIGLACICDAAIAETGTKFGLIPATIGPYVVARMGGGAAGVHVLTHVRGTRGTRAGHCRQGRGGRRAGRGGRGRNHTLSFGRPGAVAASKALARALGPKIDMAVIAETVSRLADTWDGEEAAHGIDAFLSKKSPRWAQ